MIYSPQSLVHVYYHGFTTPVLVGRLLLNNRELFFEYDTHFLTMGLNISPFKCPLKPGVIRASDRCFDGLFGVFNDSLPDGWGRLLLDRKLMQLGISPAKLSPLDRLCFVGKHGMGALSYEPEHTDYFKPATHNSNDVTVLDKIANEICLTIDNHNDTYLDELIEFCGSSCGARPKVFLQSNNQEWLIKFKSHQDPIDIAAIEYAYHLMAKAAGLIVPDAKLFPSKQGPGYFGVTRFDREIDKRLHTHTLSGLLHADHREPSLDYEIILKATHYLTRDIKECEKQFRHAVFNVLTHNRDDHAKNFSFIMRNTGEWQVSPAYDLNYSSGPAGEHCTMIMGDGRTPGEAQLLKLANVSNLSINTAKLIIAQVRDACTRWHEFASIAGVSQQQTKIIAKAIAATAKAH